MVPRRATAYFQGLLAKSPIVTVTGPRQSGKTTLCKQVCSHLPYANLEAPDVRAFAEADPRGFLQRYPDGAVFDEVQHVPGLLSYLQVLVDADPRNGRFVLTGSHQLLLDERVSQSLAGRTGLMTLLPLSLAEVRAFGDVPSTDDVLFRGCYPRLYDQGLDPTQALGDYVATYVERDVRQLSQIRDLALFRRFVAVCAGRVGQLLNYQSLGNDLGISHTTARQWISLLEASYIVHVLPPWHENIGKRLTKSPKLYFGDVGLASYLLGIEKKDQLATHPLRGALFENLVVLEVLKYRCNQGRRSNLHFYRDSAGLEVDLVLPHGDGIVALEAKAGATMNSRWFDAMRKFADATKRPVSRQVLVYDGASPGVRDGVTVTNPHGLAEVLDAAFA